MLKGKDVCVDTKSKRRVFTLPDEFESSTDANFIFDTNFGKARIFAAIISLLLAIFIQEGFLNGLRLVSVKPNLFLVVLLCFSVSMDAKSAMILGAASGFFMDITYGRFLGFYAILYMYLAVIASAIVGRKIKGRPFYFFIFSPIAFFVFGVFQSVLSRLLIMYNSKSIVFFENFGQHILRRILPLSLYNGLLFIILIWPFTFLWIRLGRRYNSTKKVFR